MQNYLSGFCDTIRGDNNYIKNHETSFDIELLEYINGDYLRIYEASSEGLIV